MDLFYCIAISLVGLFLLIINCGLYLYTYSGKDRLYKSFTLYLIVLAFYETVCTVVGILKPGQNVYLVHYNFNFQFLLLSLFFYQILQGDFFKKMIIFNLLAVWLLLAIQYYHDPGLYWRFNIPEIVGISLLLICYALIHIYQNLGETKQYFYVSIGVVLFYLCGSIIFMSGNLDLVIWQKPYLDIWVFNSLFFIAFQILTFKEWRYVNRPKLAHD
jgi:hypothetical protein